METLITAVVEGQREQVMGLRQNSMLNINAANHTGLNAFGICCTTGNNKGFEILMEAKANIEVSGCEGLSVLGLAAKEGKTDMVDLLLDAKAKVDGWFNDCLVVVLFCYWVIFLFPSFLFFSLLFLSFA